MHIQAIKTHRIEYGDSINKILEQYLPILSNGDIVAITSKILSIIQNRVINKDNIVKRDLIHQEADMVLDAQHSPYDLYLTIKNSILIPSAGIDESNSNGNYILYPENIQATAALIWAYLKQQHNLTKLGIIITDSHTTIMRRGVTGIALAWCGFEPIYSYKNKPDIFGNNLKVTEVNILDSLATAAVFTMGEGSEQTPLAIIKNAPKINFVDRIPTSNEEAYINISMDEDLYAPLLKAAKWLKK